jgi:hypothetical protein
LCWCLACGGSLWPRRGFILGSGRFRGGSCRGGRGSGCGGSFSYAIVVVAIEAFILIAALEASASIVTSLVDGARRDDKLAFVHVDALLGRTVPDVAAVAAREAAK